VYKNWQPNEKHKELFELHRVEVGISEYLFGAVFKINRQKYMVYKLEPKSEKKKVIAKNLVTGQDEHFSIATVICGTGFQSPRKWLEENNLEAFLL